jgi:hypothetical protein
MVKVDKELLSEVYSHEELALGVCFNIGVLDPKL